LGVTLSGVAALVCSICFICRIKVRYFVSVVCSIYCSFEGCRGIYARPYESCYMACHFYAFWPVSALNRVSVFVCLILNKASNLLQHQLAKNYERAPRGRLPFKKVLFVHCGDYTMRVWYLFRVFSLNGLQRKLSAYTFKVLSREESMSANVLL